MFSNVNDVISSISRGNDTYKEVEKFEKLEFTHSLAYELARRNNYVVDILELLYYSFFYYENVIFPKMNTRWCFSKDENSIIKFEKTCRVYYIMLLKKYKKSDYISDFQNVKLENIVNKVSNLVKVLTKELYEKYYIIYQVDPEIKNDYLEIYDSKIYLERDTTLTKHLQQFRTNNFKSNLRSKKNYIVYQEVDCSQKIFTFNTIYPDFKAALRNFADTNVFINLNLPKDELVDFISKIKDDYDTENSTIKTPLEILGESLIIVDDFINMNNNKWADILFIYDYYNYNLSYTKKSEVSIKKEIQLLLTKYYGVKIKKTQAEIKNSKDTKYKIVPWNIFLKENPCFDEEKVDFEEIDDEKAYLSIKAIENKYKVLKKYIEGDNPKYKTLIFR